MISNTMTPTQLSVHDFFYELPEELIAQEPVDPRDHSRLMVLDREEKSIDDKKFYDIIDYLNAGDVLVINDSKVIPARIYGEKEGSGGPVEVVPTWRTPQRRRLACELHTEPSRTTIGLRLRILGCCRPSRAARHRGA